MKCQLMSLAALAAIAKAELDIAALLAEAVPAPDTDPRFTAFQPPGEGDVRSPCPGLNSLSNHGFLNRNGKNITIPQLIVGGAQGLGIGADFMTVIGAIGLLSSPDPAGGSFDLNNLDEHDFPIEHDASLSRQDAYFGNWYDFDPEVWNKTASFFKGETHTTVQTTSSARYARVQDSLANDPKVLYGPVQFILSSGETGLYVQTMSSPLINSAPIEYVNSLFVDQKLPYDLGWRPSAIPITLLSLGIYATEIFLVNPDKFAEGLAILNGTYADVLVDLAGGASALRNLTAGISDYVGIPGL